MHNGTDVSCPNIQHSIYMVYLHDTGVSEKLGKRTLR